MQASHEGTDRARTGTLDFRVPVHASHEGTEGARTGTLDFGVPVQASKVGEEIKSIAGPSGRAPLRENE